MTSDRWRRIEQLYHAAEQIEEPSRSDFLVRACGGDSGLLSELQRMLSVESGRSAVLDKPAWQLDPGATRTIAVQENSRLGPYLLKSKIGSGGMGTVFLAEDTRLGRKVAVKVSNAEYSDRFQREAHAIAALNHPNICTLYDVGPNYLVMESLEGETLAARLKKGRLSASDTLGYGAQIAGALAEAHAKGITHRDLKPGNVMLTKSGAKVLDFGLAKSQTQSGGMATATHAIMGTPAYMAPEQFEGKDIGPWTDIYALGLVLNESATGKRRPHGEPLSQKDMPPQLARVIERCLAEAPEDRWQSAGDLKAALELMALPSAEAGPSPKDGPPSKQRVRVRIAAGLLGAAVLAVGAGFWLGQPSEEKPFKFSMPPPDGTSFVHVSQGGPIALAPDGRRIAFVAEGSGGRSLWVRSLDGFGARSLAGTEGAENIFWSPDSRWIGFFAGTNLKKVDPDEGKVQVIATVRPSLSLSGSWNADDKILYYPNDIPLGNILKLVDASGGQPVQVTSRNNELLDENHVFPNFLPDGNGYLLEVRGGPELDRNLWLGSVGSNDRHLLLKGVSDAQYAPPRRGAPGYLVFARNGNLMAQPFDAAKRVLSGTAVTIAENIASAGTGLADFSVSNSGVLAYRTSPSAATHEMIWYDRHGAVIGTIGERPGNPRNSIRISPDGKAIAFTRQAGETQEIWIHDLVRGASSPLTLNGGRSPVWSPDGSQIAFVREDAIYRMPATGGAETLVWRGPRLISVNDWSGDGKSLVLTRWDENGVRQTWLLTDPMAAERKYGPSLLANGIHAEFAPAIGKPRWVSYDHDQVNVRGMPGDSSGPWQVSVDGGNGTRFRRDGREMYFITGSNLMAVDVELGPPFRAGAPHVLCPIPKAIQVGQGQYAQGYDVTADGSKFLATFPTPETPASTITVVKNWQLTLGK